MHTVFFLQHVGNLKKIKKSSKIIFIISSCLCFQLSMNLLHGFNIVRLYLSYSVAFIKSVLHWVFFLTSAVHHFLENVFSAFMLDSWISLHSGQIDLLHAGQIA